jgi:hypothetical protein
MSRRNGDRARFQKNRKRQVKHRQQIRELTAKLLAKPVDDPTSATK